MKLPNPEDKFSNVLTHFIFDCIYEAYHNLNKYTCRSIQFLIYNSINLVMKFQYSYTK